MGAGAVKKPVFVKWIEKKQFIGTDSGRHSIVISSHDDDNHTGMKPTDLMLIALGSCSAYDVVGILQKKRLQVQDLVVMLDADKDPEPPWAFRKIRMHFTITGPDISEKAADQAISLSHEKYCSVAATLSGVADITFTFDLIRP